MSQRQSLQQTITENLSTLNDEQLAELRRHMLAVANCSDGGGLGDSRRDGANAVDRREELFRELTDSLPNLVWQLLPNGETAYVNRRWREYFARETGMPEAEWTQVVHPEDLDNFFGRWQTVNDGGLLDPLPARLLRHDGEYRWFSKRARAIYDATGELQYWIYTATDIHAQKQAEEALRLEEERLRMALRSAQMGVWDWDMLTGEINWDSASRVAFGLLPDGLIDYESFRRCVHPDDLERVEELIGKALDPKGNGRYEVDYRVIGIVDRLMRTIHVEGRVFFSNIGSTRKAVRFIGIVQDNTKRQQGEDALRQANIDLQQFAYAAAHDLQEPLRNISLSLGLLKLDYRGTLCEPAAKLVDTSIDGAQRMHGLVTDLLALTRVSTEGVAENLTPVDAHQVLERVLANLAATLEESGAQIEADHLPALLIHETHLLQLLQNLIGNAIKYRKRDAVPIVKIKAERGFGLWQISVADNGIGFDEVHKEQIFGVFKRLHNRHEYAGSGIGLAICARIVTIYGGRIWAEGSPDQGATFFFTLPSSESLEPDYPKSRSNPV